MNKTVINFIEAMSRRFPLSTRKGIEEKRPDLLSSLKDNQSAYEEIEKQENFTYPQIVKDLQKFTNEFFIYTDIPMYRHMSSPSTVIENLNEFREFNKKLDGEFDYYIDRKICFFDADGNQDLLDFTRYNKENDDCPIIYFNHEDPDERITLFESVKQFLELMTIELNSGDFCNYDNGDNEELYIKRMEQRGTQQLACLLEN